MSYLGAMKIEYTLVTGHAPCAQYLRHVQMSSTKRARTRRWESSYQIPQTRIRDRDMGMKRHGRRGDSVDRPKTLLPKQGPRVHTRADSSGRSNILSPLGLVPGPGGDRFTIREPVGVHKMRRPWEASQYREPKILITST